jgi:hypothetical protein
MHIIKVNTKTQSVTINGEYNKTVYRSLIKAAMLFAPQPDTDFIVLDVSTEPMSENDLVVKLASYASECLYQVFDRNDKIAQFVACNEGMQNLFGLHTQLYVKQHS